MSNSRQISPHDRFFSAKVLLGIRKKYHVCFGALLTREMEKELDLTISTGVGVGGSGSVGGFGVLLSFLLLLLLFFFLGGGGGVNNF